MTTHDAPSARSPLSHPRLAGGPSDLSLRPAHLVTSRLGLAAVAVVIAWLAFGIFGHDPWKPDEAYSFGIALESARTGNAIVPMLAGEPFMEKPPLFYVVAGWSSLVFGHVLPLHDAARLATLGFAALGLLFLALTARALDGPRAAVVAVLAAMGSVDLLPLAHLLVTDIALFAGLAMALYGLARARETAAGGTWIGLGIAIAFLAKGALGPGWIGLVALLLPLFPAWRHATYVRALALALPGIAVALAWCVALAIQSPELFRVWLVENNIARFTGGTRIGPHNPWWFYAQVLPLLAFPAWPLALCVFRGPAGARRARLREPRMVLPLACAAVMIGVLVLASDSRRLYAVPVLLPMSLLAAAGASLAPSWLVRFLTRGAQMLFGAVALLLWGLWLARLDDIGTPLDGWLENVLPADAPAASAFAIVSAIAVTAVTLYVWRKARRGVVGAVLAWVAGLAMCWGLAMSLWLPAINAAKSYRAMFESLAPLVDRGDCLASRALGEGQRAVLPYVTGITATRLETHSTAQCRQVLIQGSRSEPPDAPGDAWSLVWEGARPGDRGELYRLFVRGREPTAVTTFPDD